MAFALKAAAAASISASPAASTGGASALASVVPMRRASMGRVSFRGAAGPVVAIRAASVAAAAAVAEHKRSISGTFADLKEQGKVARLFHSLLLLVTLTWPHTAKALKILDACGSDVIELGVPYSDPLADGPVIQASATRALAKKAPHLRMLSPMVKEVVPQLSLPSSTFHILQSDSEAWYPKLHDYCLVVPDVPLEETDILRSEASKNNLELVLLTTPTTPKERMEKIAEASEGFIYLVSTVGVTGARTNVSTKVQSLLEEIKQATEKPVAVGFGVSTPEHVKQIAEWGADGVIVGSAMNGRGNDQCAILTNLKKQTVLLLPFTPEHSATHPPSHDANVAPAGSSASPHASPSVALPPCVAPGSFASPYTSPLQLRLPMRATASSSAFPNVCRLCRSCPPPLPPF
ncbi:hypothetical protein PR202_ga28150 [Eleusine coracana subsp. coracana]|uniref:tryptophan synthase n=1 Tax=Eleusine coracana subsp. coracana TaxID=191504 RepID=A0AAV5DIH7_ELECO|nr:hypothetical protein PR202_ga28150 [Eleusine coracana subsp. coracana]